MFLIFRSETVENGNRFINGWSIYPNGLEPALEGGIFFDVFTVLVHGGGPDTLQFTAGEGRLDDIRGIHGALGRARTYERVKLVDKEENGFQLPNFLHDSFDALFELAAIFCARHHEG